MPAEFAMVDEQVLIKEASFNLIEVPAIYQTIEQDIQIALETTRWEKEKLLIVNFRI